jgi:amino acid permease
MRVIEYFREDRKFYAAVAALIGTMVGVGIFAIPLAFSKAGFLVGFVFLVLMAGITLLLNLMYGEIILRTQKDHQLVGYSEIYLGSIFRRLLFFPLALNSYIGILAYILLSGQFLNNIFSPLFYRTSDFYSIVFFIVFSLLLLLGIKRFSWVELILSGLFVTVILIIVSFSLPRIEWMNFINFSSSSNYWFLPYGVLFFAFGGLSAVPIQRQILRGKEGKLRKAIIMAVAITALLYLLFALSVVGVAGDSTSDNSINDLFMILGEKMMVLCSLFGITAIGSAYLMLGAGFQEVFNLDLGIKRIWAWALVVVPPFILFLGGMRNFVDIISLGGAVALGSESLILLYIYVKAKNVGDRHPEYCLKLSRYFLYAMAVLFSVGILLKLMLDAG